MDNMDTSRFLHLKKLDTEQIYKLYTKSQRLKDVAVTYHEVMERALARSQISDIVYTYYDLGEILEVYQIFGGYVNTSYGIYVEKEGQRFKYFVRKYKKRNYRKRNLV